jgi:nicotinate phosphoribosyltransferase
MTLGTFGIDAYQLTTLVAHADEGRLGHAVSMAFFFRRMPPSRAYVVFCGRRQILEHAAHMKLGRDELEALEAHPTLGPALRARPALRDALASVDGFSGEIDAMPEGTLAFAGPAVRTDGAPLDVAGARLVVYTPLLRVRTDMVRAKLIETPWLGYLNYMSMVASKAARVVAAAGGKTVLEFGQRRTHPAAALDATYAAYVAGVSASSNMAAYERYGIPATGTMDHFAIQASERPDWPRAEAERDFFRAYSAAFGGPTTMLVDTYDTEGGIRHAVEATAGKLAAIRIDSNVTPESIARARALLAELGAPHVRIYVSDGLDEHRVRELASVADGFGVGENITCSPDAATGIGAVAKLVVNGYGKVTMKLSKGSGKATLPGEIQAYRFRDHDLVALADEPAPSGGRPLLEPAWRGRAPVSELAKLDETRAHVRAQIEALPDELKTLAPRPPERTLVASDALAELVTRLAREAQA